VLTPDPQKCELTLTAVHPGVTVEAVREATGWPLAVAADLAVTEPPGERELEVLRRLEATKTAPG
jgi:glutaconate CoA-transferase subunit B